MKDFIVCPADKTDEEILDFWVRAGYTPGKDFILQHEKGITYILARVQMILAQDAIKFGFYH